MLEQELFDSEDDSIEDPDDGEEDPDADADAEEEEPVDALLMTPVNGDGPDDATEDGDDESPSEEEDEEEDEEEEDEDDEPSLDLGPTEEAPPPPSEQGSSTASRSPSVLPPAPSPPRQRSLSPAHLRRNQLNIPLDRLPRSFTVEAISAIPHPVPTHALAASACMSHLLTGSIDGYIRDYDIFAAVNSKNFLTAPQRQHAGVVEGLMKSGQLRFWWENPSTPRPNGVDEEPCLAPVYSLAIQSDALWALSGTDSGTINLFTLRHNPGKLAHVLQGHRGAVSALALDHDEKSVFSAGWDGEAIQWDLNTGQNIRSFTAHNAQLTSIAVRPLSPGYVESGPSGSQTLTSDPMNVDEAENSTLNHNGDPVDSDARSDNSFDPLFDDVPEDKIGPLSKLAMPGDSHNRSSFNVPRSLPNIIPPPKGAPPLFEPNIYATYSNELLMTSFIDGQVVLWDRRVQTVGQGVGRLYISEKTPPWCLSACWSADGSQIYAGRRNGTVDVWDVRLLGHSGPANTPRSLKILRNPPSSGVVSCVVAFPDCRHIASASVDNIRLWNVMENGDDISGKAKSGVAFKIIPGHHGGYISQMVVDRGARFLVSASSNRGWFGDSTKTVFVHDIKRINY